MRRRSRLGAQFNQIARGWHSNSAVRLVKKRTRGAAQTLQPGPSVAGCEDGLVDASSGVVRLGEAERESLAAYAARASWPAGFAVYQRSGSADGVFVVSRGRNVLRSRVRAGRGFVPWIATPGETFGSEGLSNNARYATDARADEESETLFL